MPQDPIVEEIRKIRRDIEKDCRDEAGLWDYLEQAQRRSKKQPVSLRGRRKALKK